MLLTAALLTLSLGCRTALDKAAMIEHIRESYQLPPEMEVELGTPSASGIPGFNLLELTFRIGASTQTEKMFLSQDGRHYLLGGFKDLSVHPDNARIEKMAVSGAASRGDEKAPVQVVEYTDFQCVFCERGYRLMRERIMVDYAGKVRWIYKSLPLVQIHPWAKPAAMAVECAKLQSVEKFWKVHDDIFEAQRAINEANFEDKLQAFVKAAGLDAGKFDACLGQKDTLKIVDQDTAEAGNIGISGTPAFVINGHLIPGADYDSIRQVIEEALKGKHGKI